MTGIYAIVHRPTKTVYIGQAQDIDTRWTKHRYYLRGNYHWNRYLQRVWNKSGEDAFYFTVLQECPIDQLTQCEQAWFDKFSEIGPVFNFGYFVDSRMRGIVPDSETREKIRQSMRKHKRTAQHCANISASKMGHSTSPEAREKMRQAKLGRKHSAETRERMSETRRRKSPNGLLPFTE